MKRHLFFGFLLISIFMLSFVSAGWFSNFFSKPTEKVVYSGLETETDFSGTGKDLALYSEGLGGYKFPYYRNYDINKINPQVKRAIIVIHGTGRNAEGYFDSVMAAATLAEKNSETIIIAPSFRVEGEDSTSGMIYWPDNSGWKIGHKSSSELSIRKSSFDIVDSFVNEFNDKTRFPNLQKIVVTGHSAGGQFTNRYAAGNRVDKSGNIPMKYVIANPSSYLYFNSGRMISGDYQSSSFYLYLFKSQCPDYNKYKYGLDNRNEYMNRVSSSVLRSQYLNRKVTYLLGSEDTSYFDEDLDKSCEGELQGFNRKERGENYFKYINIKLFGNKHKKVIVPGAEHSAGEMYKSPEGVSALFS